LQRTSRIAALHSGVPPSHCDRSGRSIGAGPREPDFSRRTKGEEIMKSKLLSLAAVLLLGAGPFAASHAQTLTTTTPNLTIRWLAGISVSPTSVTSGRDITGTVTLLRNAVSNTTVGLSLSGATPIEGNIWNSSGVLMPAQVTILAGRSTGTFTIKTPTTATWKGSKSFTVGASLGSERVSTSFSVSN
jgi:hypothetical protein